VPSIVGIIWKVVLLSTASLLNFASKNPMRDWIPLPTIVKGNARAIRGVITNANAIFFQFISAEVG
jgi:hypothetical protein